MSHIKKIAHTGRIIPGKHGGTIKLKQFQEEIIQISSRDTPGAYFDENGLLKFAPPHVIRYSKNFQTGHQDILLEDEATNVLLYNRSYGDNQEHAYSELGLDGVADTGLRLLAGN